MWWGFLLAVALAQVVDQAVAVRRRGNGWLTWGPYRAATQSGRVAVLVLFCAGAAFVGVCFIISLV